jgi:hypothetical protein
MMPKMLREILGQMLARRPALRVITGEVLASDPAAVLRECQPTTLILGRPDCDYIELDHLVQASPATRIVHLSPDGRTAVVYEPNALPLTIERPSIEDLVGITAPGSDPTE